MTMPVNPETRNLADLIDALDAHLDTQTKLKEVERELEPRFKLPRGFALTYEIQPTEESDEEGFTVDKILDDIGTEHRVGRKVINREEPFVAVQVNVSDDNVLVFKSASTASNEQTGQVRGWWQAAFHRDDLGSLEIAQFDENGVEVARLAGGIALPQTVEHHPV